MYGTPQQDIAFPPLDSRRFMGATAVYHNQVRAPYTIVPMNLRPSNKPSELNIWNTIPVFQVSQLAGQSARSTLLQQRLISHYTFIPPNSTRATFGNV